MNNTDVLRKRTGILLILICSLLIAACGQIPTNHDTSVQTQSGMTPGSTQTTAFHDYAPLPDDSKMTRSTIYQESSQLNIMESFPLQFSLQLSGSLPTPCHHLRVVPYPPDRKNQIMVEVYSLVDPETMCAEVLQGFDVTIPLGSYPTGHYSIWINGSRTFEFDA